MIVAITGHTQGIGKALADLYQSQGHQIKGFSTTNGYDISDSQCRQKITHDCRDCDIFFNNAYDWEGVESAQIEMLFDIWSVWQGQTKTIVNIGSSTTMRWDSKSSGLKYRTYKRALEDACEFYWNQDPWPFVCIMGPCLTDTQRTHHLSFDNKVDPRKFAKLVHHALSQKDFRVQVLKLAIQPQ